MAQSSNLSHLSDAHFGYDFVVGVTQASINSTMINYLSAGKQPLVEVYYVYKKDPLTNKLVQTQVSQKELLVLTQGVDPLDGKISGSDPDHDPGFQKLVAAKFAWAFSARLGIPHVSDPTKVPDMVTLQGDASSVIFNMLCSEFRIGFLDNKFGETSWIYAEQDPEKPWVFTSHVDLRLGQVPDTQYELLPPDVQKQIKNLGATAFSIQQLLLDLATARLADVPTLSGVPADVSTLVSQNFVGRYISSLKQNGDPILGCAIVNQERDVSTLEMTDFNFSVVPYLDATTGQPVMQPTPAQKQLATLNYLCAADHRPLPPANRLTWNWVDVSEQLSHHGCIAINRARLASYIIDLVFKTVRSHCIKPYVTAKHYDGNITRLHVDVHVNGDQEPSGGYTPSGGKTVVAYSYEAYASDTDQAGNVELKTRYSMDIDFVDSSIVVTQKTWVWYYLDINTTSNHDVIDNKIRTDTYPIAVDAHGKLVVLPPTSTEQQLADPHDRAANIVHVNDIAHEIQAVVRNLGALALRSLPLDTSRNYIFPGGRSFVFKSVRFSDHQDLVASITYADPVAV